MAVVLGGSGGRVALGVVTRFNGVDSPQAALATATATGDPNNVVGRGGNPRGQLPVYLCGGRPSSSSSSLLGRGEGERDRNRDCLLHAASSTLSYGFCALQQTHVEHVVA